MMAGSLGQAAGFSFSAGNSLIALFIPLLLIVPGLVAVRLGLWTARRENPFTQLEMLVLSALVSLASLFFIYVGFSIWLWQPAVSDNLQGQSLPWYVIGYCIHLLVAAATGMALSSFAYNYLLDNEARSRYDPWQYVFRQLTDPATIEVRTSSGLWIQGHLAKAEESTGTRDLLLTSANVLSHTRESNSQEIVNENITVPEEDRASTDSESTGAGDLHDQSVPSESDNSKGIESWENIDNSLDEEFKTNEEVQAALDDDSAGYIQLDGSSIEAVRVPDSPAVNTNEVYEELSDDDRVHKRAAQLGDEFGYFIIENRLRNFSRGLNRAAPRWAITVLLWVSMLVVTLSSVGIIEIDAMLGRHQAVLAWIGLITGISTVELLRYYWDSPIRWRNIPVGVGTLTPFIASIALVEWWVVGGWEIGFDIASIVAGLLGGITVGTVLHHLRDEYTATAAFAVTVMTSILLAFMSISSFGVDINSILGQSFFLLGAASALGLFCERIRVGKAGAYEDWATVLADTVALFLGIGAAGLGIWSIGIATTSGQSAYPTAVMIGFIAVLAGGAALHGVGKED